jgi:Mannosyl-glycoprotein endo-beta-N-acetylglucosaminidase
MTRFVRPSRRLAPFALVAVLALGAVGCFGPSGGAPVPVMGQSDLTAEQMAGYFWAHQPPGSPCLTVSVEELTADFQWHGNAENVRGDIAFAQSIIETGWFRYGGSVQCEQNNYGGFLGQSFPDAETGVRAQIQHLRAYADPSATSCSQPPLATPCADPVFDSVNPKGKAPNWNDMGNGNWAAASDYAGKVLTVYNDMRASAGLPGV